ncbi:MAG: hypothetical protein U0636_12065 [Phycisphaerales bacterium]
MPALSTAAAAALAAALLATPALATVTTFSGTDTPAQWLAAVGGPVTSITFDGLADGTVITNQFADQGVVFTQSGVVSNATTPGVASYLVCQGNTPANQPIQATDGFRASFSSTMHALSMSAFCPSGSVAITLYSGGNAVWSGVLGPNYNPTDSAYPLPFCGLVSDQGFDAVWVAPTPNDGFPGIGSNFLVTDTLAFSTVPGPSVVGCAVVGALWGRRRRSI